MNTSKNAFKPSLNLLIVATMSFLVTNQGTLNAQDDVGGPPDTICTAITSSGQDARNLQDTCTLIGQGTESPTACVGTFCQVYDFSVFDEPLYICYDCGAAFAPPKNRNTFDVGDRTGQFGGRRQFGSG